MAHDCSTSASKWLLWVDTAASTGWRMIAAPIHTVASPAACNSPGHDNR